MMKRTNNGIDFREGKLSHLISNARPGFLERRSAKSSFFSPEKAKVINFRAIISCFQDGDVKLSAHDTRMSFSEEFDIENPEGGVKW